MWDASTALEKADLTGEFIKKKNLYMRKAHNEGPEARAAIRPTAGGRSYTGRRFRCRMIPCAELGGRSKLSSRRFRCRMIPCARLGGSSASLPLRNENQSSKPITDV